MQGPARHNLGTPNRAPAWRDLLRRAQRPRVGIAATCLAVFLLLACLNLTVACHTHDHTETPSAEPARAISRVPEVLAEVVTDEEIQDLRDAESVCASRQRIDEIARRIPDDPIARELARDVYGHTMEHWGLAFVADAVATLRGESSYFHHRVWLERTSGEVRYGNARHFVAPAREYPDAIGAYSLIGCGMPAHEPMVGFSIELTHGVVTEASGPNAEVLRCLELGMTLYARLCLIPDGRYEFGVEPNPCRDDPGPYCQLFP